MSLFIFDPESKSWDFRNSTECQAGATADQGNLQSLKRNVQRSCHSGNQTRYCRWPCLFSRQ